jgi:hypothetical protein
VTVMEHQYQGLPPSLAAGTVALTLINRGTEPHEMEVFSIEGDQRPFTELVRLPDTERTTVLDPVGTILGGDVGDVDTALLKLPPGRYGVGCFIPQGSTTAQPGTGPPHATLGEAAEFTAR